MMAIEHLKPARPVASSTLKHNLDNLLLGVSGTLLLRLNPALLAAHLATKNEIWQIGASYALNINSNSILLIITSIILLDFCIYWQHRYFHYNKHLWKLHRVHHSDKHLSASSALRFHPVEIALSMLIKSTLVLSLGIPFVAVVLFEISLNACAIFNHTNIRLPKRLEPLVRWLIVTPSMHRIHHSVDMHYSNTNFGFCLSCWDRLFNSYSQTTGCGKDRFEMGVKELKKEETEGLLTLLSQPLKKSND